MSDSDSTVVDYGDSDSDRGDSDILEDGEIVDDDHEEGETPDTTTGHLAAQNPDEGNDHEGLDPEEDSDREDLGPEDSDSEGEISDGDANLPVDELCKAVSACVAQSNKHRKIVSHVFGRNKVSTKQLPDDAWILWCRKHYQRLRYRAKEEGYWHMTQLRLVRNQLDEFEDHCDNIQNWTIALRRKEQDELRAEDNHIATGGTINPALACWERFLVPYLGRRKSFANIRAVLGVIENEFNTPAYLARDKKEKVFPGVEFLAVFETKPEQKKSIKTEVKDSPSEETGSTGSTPSNAEKTTGNSAGSTTTNIKAASRQYSASTNKRKATATEIATNIAVEKATGPGKGPSKRRRLVLGSDL